MNKTDKIAVYYIATEDYKKDLDETRFIYLQDKRTYSIKQKQ